MEQRREQDLTALDGEGKVPLRPSSRAGRQFQLEYVDGKRHERRSEQWFTSRFPR